MVLWSDCHRRTWFFSRMTCGIAFSHSRTWFCKMTCQGHMLCHFALVDELLLSKWIIQLHYVRHPKIDVTHRARRQASSYDTVNLQLKCKIHPTRNTQLSDNSRLPPTQSRGTYSPDWSLLNYIEESLSTLPSFAFNMQHFWKIFRINDNV